MDGANGHFKDLGPCVGGINIQNLTMSGQKGGDGGDGTVTGSTQAVGGKGGNMGAMLITAPGGNITFSGTNTITTPDGGKGGNATGTGLAGGGSASALGGAGGDEAPTGFGGSPIVISAAAGSIIVNGQLNIVVGTAGDGGNATATGGKGNDGPGQPGGPATATGGAGGKTLDKQFTSVGSVGGNGTITVTGGNAGKGGDGTANGGNGGNGDPGVAGGKGGTMTAQGGNGGNAQLKNFVGALIGNGGAAGNARYTAGNGGAGGANCPNAGGNGGGGGDAAGGAGNPGTGSNAGAAGNAQANNAGNGNKGGDGSPAGGGGAKGNNGPPANPAPGSFQPGAPGGPCPGTVSLTVTPPAQPVKQGGQDTIRVVIVRGGSFTGPVTLTLKDDQGNVLATQTVAAGSTQANIPFTIPATFGAGNHTFTVTASGDGFTTVTQSVSVAVAAVTAVSVSFTNSDLVNPWTKVLYKPGTAATQNVSISPTGTATISVPTTPMPVVLTFHQRIGNNRLTSDYEIRSDELIGLGSAPFNVPATGSFTYNVMNVPPNGAGASWAGPTTVFWPQPHAGTFSVNLRGVPLNTQLVYGCHVADANQEPMSATIWVGTIANLSGSTCDFGAGGLKSFVSTQTTVTGASNGASLHFFSGFNHGGYQTTIRSKDITGSATTNFFGLAIADLPSGVSQFQSVLQISGNTEQEVDYFFNGAAPWTAVVPPAVNIPTITNTVLGGYYQFTAQVATQPAYSGAWILSYFQANSVGEQNQVFKLATPSYYGSGFPPTVSLVTPGDPLVDSSYMPKPGFGTVTGSFFAYSYFPFKAPIPGDTRSLGVVFNLLF